MTISTPHNTRNTTSKAFVRATRPTFLCASPKNDHCARKNGILTDSATRDLKRSETLFDPKIPFRVMTLKVENFRSHHHQCGQKKHKTKRNARTRSPSSKRQSHVFSNGMNVSLPAALWYHKADLLVDISLLFGRH